MHEEVFRTLQNNYQKGIFSEPTVFYFSIDDIQKTLILDADGCKLQDGKPVEDADCSCKISTEFFNKIWKDGYKPGIIDFMSGKIKSNAPLLLQQFLQAFGK